jgi:hypothetical protein
VNRASDAYRGESKTDARDARVIVDQARMRPDLDELEPGEEEVAQLRILLGRRDLLVDQNRTIARLGEALLSLSPALERMLDLNRRGPLTLLTATRAPRDSGGRDTSASPPTSENTASRDSTASPPGLSVLPSLRASPCRPSRSLPASSPSSPQRSSLSKTASRT